MIRIERCSEADAQLISRAILMALGMESDNDEQHFETRFSIETWRGIFTNLAARTDSQYSYANSLKAIMPDGNIGGILVSYDGGKLHQLREAFFEEVERATGCDWRGTLSDETEPGEWYLDSLAVWPEYRKRGVASALLNAGIANGGEHDRIPGLLVDKENPGAARLYYSLGFDKVGDRPFAGTMMDHLQLNPDCLSKIF